MKIRVIEGRPVAGNVYINGRGPYTFLLDIAAQTNHIDERLAGKLGLQRTARLEVVTISGTRMISAGQVDEIRLGEAAAKHQEMIFGDMSAVRQLVPEADGVLGQEFLGKFDYLLDFRARRIVFGPISTASPRIQVRKLHGCMAVFSNLGDLLLDSGTDTLIVFSNKEESAAFQLVTSTGAIAANTGRRSRLMIDGVAYSAAKSVTMVPRGGQGNGLLPMAVFQSVYISNSGNYIIPNPTVD